MIEMIASLKISNKPTSESFQCYKRSMGRNLLLTKHLTQCNYAIIAMYTRLVGRFIGSLVDLLANMPLENHELIMSTGYQLVCFRWLWENLSLSWRRIMGNRKSHSCEYEAFSVLLCFPCLKLLTKEQAEPSLVEKKNVIFHYSWKLFFQV